MEFERYSVTVTPVGTNDIPVDNPVLPLDTVVYVVLETRFRFFIDSLST